MVDYYMAATAGGPKFYCAQLRTYTTNDIMPVSKGGEGALSVE